MARTMRFALDAAGTLHAWPAVAGVRVVAAVTVRPRAVVPAATAARPTRKGRERSERNAKIALGYADGMTCKALANRFGITDERVRQIVRGAGLPAALPGGDRRAGLELPALLKPEGGGIPGQRIDLSAVGSAMDTRAAKAEVARAAAALVARLPEDGKIWCGPCAARVPSWFGDNCISTKCPLKGGFDD